MWSNEEKLDVKILCMDSSMFLFCKLEFVSHKNVLKLKRNRMTME
jgi:hypothetical protein